MPYCLSYIVFINEYCTYSPYYIYIMNILEVTSIILCALPITAIAVSSVIVVFANPEDDKRGGTNDEKRFGECKKEFNENDCKKKDTSGN